MRIFVTGATGFIGSHFLIAALENDFSVLALRRSILSSTRIQLKCEPEWIQIAMEDLGKVHFQRVDGVVHLAAHSPNYPYDSLSNCLHWNLIVPLQMFEKARQAGVSKFLVAGSCFEYGKSGERFKFIPANAPLEPTLPYPASKAAASISFIQWAQDYKVSLSLCRIFQAYGIGEHKSRLWPSIVRAAKEGHNFRMSEGDQLRDFVPVQIVANSLLLHCLHLHNTSVPEVSVSNIGTGCPLSLYSFCERIWDEYGARGELIRGAIPYRHGEIMRYVPCLRKYLI